MPALYYAVYLTEVSKELLLKAIPPKHVNVYAEHITIAFKPEIAVAFWLERMCNSADRLVQFTVIGSYADENGQAALIDEALRIDDGRAHITISCDERIKPVYSNELIEKGKGYIELDVPLKLVGTLSPNKK